LIKKGIKLPDELAPVAWALLLGGLAFLAIEFFLRGKKLSNQDHMEHRPRRRTQPAGAAVFPGSSRSGTTILMCLLLGLARPAATEFSFLVGIPHMLAAGGWKIFKALHHPSPLAPHENWGWFCSPLP